MRQETNKEIDLLLRRLSGHDGEAARDAETQMENGHLDADELSSYAQNVVPPKARTRHTAHLAECSTCRRLASELSLALGVTAAAAPVETVPAAAGLKKFLSGLFSPMVLRYAVPALGVVLVMAIGFVVLRQRQADERLVAKVDVSTSRPAAGSLDQAGKPVPPAEQLQETQEGQRGSAKAANETARPREGSSVEAPEIRDSKIAATADPAAAAPAPVTVASPDAVNSYSPRTVAQLPVLSPTPALTAAPKSNITTGAETDESKSKKETVAKAETERPAKTAEIQTDKEKEQANQPANPTLRPAGRIASDRVDENKAKSDSDTRALARAGARATSRRRAEDSKDDVETRSIAGRKFRNDGGIWTDTAYDSSTRTVNMARGSEQFRGLIADEPAIGKIAEQLDGEVIVVWKGRAYRIR